MVRVPLIPATLTCSTALQNICSIVNGACTWHPALFDFNHVYSNRQPSSQGAAFGIKNHGIAQTGYLPALHWQKALNAGYLCSIDVGLFRNSEAQRMRSIRSKKYSDMVCSGQAGWVYEFNERIIWTSLVVMHCSQSNLLNWSKIISALSSVSDKGLVSFSRKPGFLISQLAGEK